MRQALVEQVPPHRRLDIHRDAARSLAAAGAAPSLVARHWLDGGRRDEAEPWLLAAARRAWSLGAFADALDQLDPLLAHRPEHTAALRLRAEVLDALGDRPRPCRLRGRRQAAGGSEAHDLRAMQALAEIKQGDPAAALRTLDGLAPASLPGRLAQALAYSGAAVMGFATPEPGTATAAECRRLALGVRRPVGAGDRVLGPGRRRARPQRPAARASGPTCSTRTRCASSRSACSTATCA